MPLIRFSSSRLDDVNKQNRKIYQLKNNALVKPYKADGACYCYSKTNSLTIRRLLSKQKQIKKLEDDMDKLKAEFMEDADLALAETGYTNFTVCSDEGALITSQSNTGTVDHIPATKKVDNQVWREMFTTQKVYKPSKDLVNCAVILSFHRYWLFFGVAELEKKFHQHFGFTDSQIKQIMKNLNSRYDKCIHYLETVMNMTEFQAEEIADLLERARNWKLISKVMSQLGLNPNSEEDFAYFEKLVSRTIDLVSTQSVKVIGY